MEAGQQRKATDSLTPLGPVRFGRYTILGRLGSGGMADALLAMMHGELGFQKLVVLKRMHASLAQDEHFLRMFLDEARLAARLNHPNVVQTAEVGEVAGQYFIAMEYLEGQSLDRVARRYAAQHQLLPLPLLVRVLCDALEGLHYAHELRDFDGTELAVVHRDVTPSNLFVTYDGAAKVLDFGIAKASTQDEATRTGMLKGKLAYMSPEQFFSDPIDRRSDLWSMGVVVWELSTGRRLFKGQSDAATYTNITSAPVPSILDHRPDAPAALDEVIARALARDRAVRYPTADAMGRDLESVLQNHLVSVGRVEVAAELRLLFGETIENNRRAVREYARLDAAVPTAQPLGLSSLGVLKPGAGGTLAPTATSINVRDLQIADETPVERSGVAPVLRPGTRAPAQDDDVDAGEPTQVNRRDFQVSAFDGRTPVVSSVFVEVDAIDPTVPAPPPTGVPSPVFPARLAPTPTPLPAIDATFGPLPTRAQRRASAWWWLLTAALLLGGAGALYLAIPTLVSGWNDLVHGPPPDPMRQGSFHLRIESVPPGARVLDGAQALGVTPVEVDIARASVFTHPRPFLLQHPGYEAITAVQLNTAAPTATLRVTMLPEGGVVAPGTVPLQVNHRTPLRGR